MWAFVVATGSTLALAGAVAVFVAYPGRGRRIPHAERLNGAVSRATDRLPDDLAREFVSSRR